MEGTAFWGLKQKKRKHISTLIERHLERSRGSERTMGRDQNNLITFKFWRLKLRLALELRYIIDQTGFKTSTQNPYYQTYREMSLYIYSINLQLNSAQNPLECWGLLI